MLATVLAGLLTLFDPASPALAQAAVVRSHYLRTGDGVRLHYLEAGPRGRKSARHTIILIPGWSMPASIWSAQLSDLGRHWRIIALDPRGQGRSSVPLQGFHVDRRADDIHELLKMAPGSILVGWSLGALEALNVVHRHGERLIAGLMVVDSSIGEGPPSASGGFVGELRADRAGALDAFLKAIFATAQPARLHDRLLRQALRMPLESSIALFPSTVPREQWRDTVRGLRKPFAYVITPRYGVQARALAEARPDARIEIFEDAGHALFVDDAPRFNRLLGEFAARIWEQRAPR